MADDGPLWSNRYLDWSGLQAVFPEHDVVAGWMWERARRCPATDELVHWFKQCASRRYLRLDRHGRPYGEDDDGRPVAVEDPGAMLLLFIAEAYGPFGAELPGTVIIPEALRTTRESLFRVGGVPGEDP